MYEFQNTSHHTTASMVAAIAEEWLTAGGANSEKTIRTEILPGNTAESMADECIAGMGLDQQEKYPEGKNWMEARKMQRADLVAAFEKLIAQYSSSETASQRILAIEDNGGGLHIAIVQGDACTGFFSGFEHGGKNAPSMKEEILGAATNGTQDWEGNAQDPQENYDYFLAHSSAYRIIGEWLNNEVVIYSHNMGNAGERWARVPN